jgi:hypothetical protein
MELAKQILQDALLDQSPRNYLYGYFSDMYKDAWNVRPRWIGREDYSLSRFAFEIAKLHEQVAQQIKYERDQEEKKKQERKQEREQTKAKIKEAMTQSSGFTIGELGLL